MKGRLTSEEVKMVWGGGLRMAEGEGLSDIECGGHLVGGTWQAEAN